MALWSARVDKVDEDLGGRSSQIVAGHVPLQEGDLIRWHGRLAVVDDVVTFAEAGTHLTISFLDRRGLPLSVRLGDLAGAEHWVRAARLP